MRQHAGTGCCITEIVMSAARLLDPLFPGRQRYAFEDRAEQRAPAHSSEGVRGNGDVDSIVQFEAGRSFSRHHRLQWRNLSEVAARVIEHDLRLIAVAREAHDERPLTRTQPAPRLEQS